MKKLFFLIGLIFVSVFSQTNLFCDSWEIKSKTEEDFTLELYNAPMEPNSFFRETLAKVYAQSFTPIYGKVDGDFIKAEKTLFDEFNGWADTWDKEFLKIWNDGLEIKCMLLKQEDKVVGFAFFLNDFEKEYGGNSFEEDGYRNEGKILKENEKFRALVAVIPEMQGKGLGRELIFSISKLFSETKKIILYSENIFEDAIAIYEHLGFESYLEKNLKYNSERAKIFQWINPLIN